jgi:hypothetical protein
MMYRLFLATILLSAHLLVGGSSPATTGRIVDAQTLLPIADAIVTLGERVVHTGTDGTFAVRGDGPQLAVRAYGYSRVSVAIEGPEGIQGQIALQRFRPKALYLTSLGIASRALREAALDIVDHSEVNALVIDVKGDRGFAAFPSITPLAIVIGAERSPTIASLRELTDSLHAKGIYCIARIVVFKDNVLAHARPDLAVKTQSGDLWVDREHLAWTDPFLREVWEYNVALAVEAARGGFDEIQFDYIRFPDAPGLLFSQRSDAQSRTASIAGFLELAQQRLAQYNVFVAADIFGYVCWNLDDTGIGQTLAGMLAHVDYLSPMLYPSTFQFGIPGYRDPVAHPSEVVQKSLERALERTQVSPARFRPWLQAFHDYAFDRRAFEGPEIHAQISAADQAGSNGWMLWNPRNVYSSAGLGPKPPAVAGSVVSGRP